MGGPSQHGKKGRDEGVSMYRFMRDAERSCTPLDGFGGILTFRWGKSHNGDFGLATNLTLFFLGRLYIISRVVSHNHQFLFLARNEYLSSTVSRGMYRQKTKLGKQSTLQSLS